MSLRLPFTRRSLALGLAASLLTGLVAAPQAAQAEGTLRISEQFGVVYLLLHVARDQGLIEKHGKEEGVDIKVSWTKLSGGAAVNEAVLSGAVDVGSAGLGPLLTLWDRTRGRRNVKAVAGLGAFPYYLVTNNPAVKTLADFTAKDRIAVPAVTVSVQSRFLQYAAAQAFGEQNWNRLEPLTVAVPHPDAAAAVISGGTEIDSHFANPPFQEQELASGKVHRVLSSYDVMGGANSPTLVFVTEKFRQDNPKTYKAFREALIEAGQIIAKDKAAAARTYIKVENSKLDPALVQQIIESPEVNFDTAPQNTLKLAQFMYRIGAIRNQPSSWQDYFFVDAPDQQGS
ncbi:ABC transporter substrate-binding protein [Pseudomonas oryzihabitans]|uniref:ABC transporter substrate-binding protein n=1 Tax=Pseudomonas oryzihabitans TaxID=47885 RepID=UPI00286374DB|nr:ABC transporter substrate-binding protein [Pseudomonas psychrotolerans]MDR6680389.1 NitT/TauT family transport system substrate-binding protein [Pseudomonas psychrotolerans]